MVAITSRGPFLAQGSPASRNLLQFDLWERKPRSGRWDWAALKVPGPGRGWGEMQRSMVGGWWLVNIWELMLIFWGLVAFLSGMPFWWIFHLLKLEIRAGEDRPVRLEELPVGGTDAHGQHCTDLGDPGAMNLMVVTRGCRGPYLLSHAHEILHGNMRKRGGWTVLHHIKMPNFWRFRNSPAEFEDLWGVDWVRHPQWLRVALGNWGTTSPLSPTPRTCTSDGSCPESLSRSLGHRWCLKFLEMGNLEQPWWGTPLFQPCNHVLDRHSLGTQHARTVDFWWFGVPGNGVCVCVPWMVGKILLLTGRCQIFSGEPAFAEGAGWTCPCIGMARNHFYATSCGTLFATF